VDSVQRFWQLPHRITGGFRQDHQVFSDLLLLHPKQMNEETNVKIKAELIFVAGLGGHYLETWQAVDNTIWPRDLLHLKRYGVDDVRVWSFHYNTTLRGSSAAAKIDDHARELLGRIMIKLVGNWIWAPESDGSDGNMALQLKPIIFIGHSLGGMLIKRAMLIANTEENYKILWDATRGAMFFAVPHHGLDRQDWRHYLKTVLNINSPIPGLKPRSTMEAQAIMNSETLFRITDEFRRLQEYLFFVNYIEGNLMPGLEAPLVDEGRGWMDAPRKLQFKLEGHHLGICKFEKKNHHAQITGGFDIVVSHLKHLMDASKALEHIGDEAKAALESLCPTGFHGYFMAKQATRGTCQWIAERKEFRDWAGKEKESRMLWIQGPPASGKSFLTRHIITDLIPPSTSQKVAHCFLDESMPGRRTLVDLLRATLHHALRVEPELIQHYLVPPYKKAIRTLQIPFSDSVIWTQQILVPLWPQVVAEVTARGLLTVVVDGFDEMSRQCQDGFFACIDDFEAKAESQEHKENLKLLLVSREDGKAKARKDFQHYTITRDDIRQDVEKTVMAALTNPDNWEGPDLEFVERRLKSLDKNQVEQIREIIVDNSGGDHHLAKLKAQELFSSLVVEPLNTTIALAKELPSDTSGLYDRILMRTQQDSTYLPFVKHILRWAAFQAEPLKEAELNTALAFSMARDQAPARQITTHELESFQRLVGSTRLMIEKHGRRLVEIREGVLQPVDPTLKNCLTKPSSDGLLHLEEDTSHAALASICIDYLTLPYFEDSRKPTADSLDGKVKKRMEEHAFSRYAALHWDGHVEAAGPAWHAVEGHTICARELLEDETTHFSISCSEIRWYLKQRTMQGFPLVYQDTSHEAIAPTSGVDSSPNAESLEESPDVSPNTPFEESGTFAEIGEGTRGMKRKNEVLTLPQQQVGESVQGITTRPITTQPSIDPTPPSRHGDAISQVGEREEIALEIDKTFQNLVDVSYKPSQPPRGLDRHEVVEWGETPRAVEGHPQQNTTTQTHTQLSGVANPPRTKLPAPEKEAQRTVGGIDTAQLPRQTKPKDTLALQRDTHGVSNSLAEKPTMNVEPTGSLPAAAARHVDTKPKPSYNPPILPSDRGLSDKAGQTEDKRQQEKRSFYERLKQDPHLINLVPQPPNINLDTKRDPLSALPTDTTPINTSQASRPKPTVQHNLPQVAPLPPPPQPNPPRLEPAVEPRSKAIHNVKRPEEATTAPIRPPVPQNSRTMTTTKRLNELEDPLKSEYIKNPAPARPPSPTRPPPPTLPPTSTRRSDSIPNKNPTLWNDPQQIVDPRQRPILPPRQPTADSDRPSEDGSERSESVAGDTPAQKGKRSLLRRALHKTAKRVDETVERTKNKLGMFPSFELMARAC
ncbi:hypothetical protein QBC41DRAFT_399337, partial [Cercophora samala]